MKRKLDTLALLVQWGERFCLLLIFFPLTLRAEADTVVALRNALRDANSDSLRFVLYERLAKAQLDSSFDAASTTFAQWVDLAIKREAFRDAGRAENCWGIEYLHRGDLPQAFRHFSRSVQNYQEVADASGLARAYNNMGITLRREGRFKEAFLAFLEAMKGFKAANDALGTAMVYNNLAQIYYQYGQYGQALEYFSEYVRYNKTNRKALETANGENNLGATYYELKDYKNALSHYYRSYAIYDSLDNKLGIALASDNIGLMLRELRQMEDAISHHQRAVTIFRDSSRMYQLTMSLGNLCSTYRLAGEQQRALETGLEALQLADSLSFDELKTLILEELAFVYEEKGNFRTAYNYAKQCNEQLKKEAQDKGQENLNEWSKDPQLLEDLILRATNENPPSDVLPNTLPEVTVYLPYLLFVVGGVCGCLCMFVFYRTRSKRQKRIS